jgi:hypothetical protein
MLVKCPQRTVQHVEISVARVHDRLCDIVPLYLLDGWETDLAEQIGQRRIVIREDVTLDCLRMPMLYRPCCTAWIAGEGI